MRRWGVWTPGAGYRSTAPKKELEVSQDITAQAQSSRLSSVLPKKNPTAQG